MPRSRYNRGNPGARRAALHPTRIRLFWIIQFKCFLAYQLLVKGISYVSVACSHGELVQVFLLRKNCTK